MKAFKGALKGMGAPKLGFQAFVKKEMLSFDNLKYGAKELLEEGGSEAIATLSGNFADILSGNKEVNIWDNVAESFVSGTIISTGLKYIVQLPLLLGRKTQIKKLVKIL